MPQVEIDGQKLFYAVHPIRKKCPIAVVLIHGAGGTHLDWAQKLRHLEGATVYALDLPAHGRSDRSSAFPITIPAYAQLITTFIQQLSQPTCLIGHSMGGAIAQTVALQPPVNLKGIVLLGTGARLRVTEKLLTFTDEEYPTIARWLASFFWTEGTPITILDRSQQRLLQIPPAITRADFYACQQFSLLDQLGQLTLPTLVIGSTGDKLTPFKYSQQLAEQIPHAQLMMIENAGHMFHLAEPEKVAAAVQQFIADLDVFPTRGSWLALPGHDG